MSNEARSGSGDGGCFSPIAFVLLVWALLFGVTINGVHYGLDGCSEEDGIKIDVGRRDAGRP